MQIVCKLKSSYNLNRCNCLIMKWTLKDLNLRPSDYESDALTS